MQTTTKNLKIVILIISCQKYLDRQQFSKETWLKSANDIDKRQLECFFVVGGVSKEKEGINGNVIFLACGDYYEDLPFKVHAAIKYATIHLDFDYIFKTDEDVWINVNRLLTSSFALYDFCGLVNGGVTNNTRDWHMGKCNSDHLNNTKYEGVYHGSWCCGGGYFLSHRACQILSKTSIPEKELYEDKAIADILRQCGILPQSLQNTLCFTFNYQGGLEKFIAIHLDNACGISELMKRFKWCADMLLFQPRTFNELLEF